MRINLASVLVDDQEKALRFYTDVLGFVKKTEFPVGQHRWLTVVSPEDPDGVELALEPDEHPAAKPFKEALVTDGIPFTSFALGQSLLRPRPVVGAGVADVGRGVLDGRRLVGRRLVGRRGAGPVGAVGG